jgi:hypothetical protein
MVLEVDCRHSITYDKVAFYDFYKKTMLIYLVDNALPIRLMIKSPFTNSTKKNDAVFFVTIIQTATVEACSISSALLQ